MKSTWTLRLKSTLKWPKSRAVSRFSLVKFSQVKNCTLYLLFFTGMVFGNPKTCYLPLKAGICWFRLMFNYEISWSQSEKKCWENLLYHWGSYKNGLSQIQMFPLVMIQDLLQTQNLDILIDDDEDNYFRFSVTTKRLAKLANGSLLLQADATYKTNWHGFPVHVIGTTDASNKFHPFLLSVTEGEKQEDFGFSFKSIKKAVINEFPNSTFPPNYLLADAAKSISNGYFQAYGTEAKVLMCWYHTIACVDKKLESLVLIVENRPLLRLDIIELQTCCSEDLFWQGVELFKAKWRGVEEPFLNYFVSNWLDVNVNWFEGFGLGLPSLLIMD